MVISPLGERACPTGPSRVLLPPRWKYTRRSAPASALEHLEATILHLGCGTPEVVSLPPGVVAGWPWAWQVLRESPVYVGGSHQPWPH